VFWERDKHFNEWRENYHDVVWWTSVGPPWLRLKSRQIQCSDRNDKDCSENCNQPSRWTVSILIGPLPILCGSHLLRTCFTEGRRLVVRFVEEGLLHQMLKPHLSLFLILSESSLWFLSLFTPVLCCTVYFLASFTTFEDWWYWSIATSINLKRFRVSEWRPTCCTRCPGRILGDVWGSHGDDSEESCPVGYNAFSFAGTNFPTFGAAAANFWQNKLRHIPYSVYVSCSFIFTTPLTL
jgi:hypothetical protein